MQQREIADHIRQHQISGDRGREDGQRAHKIRLAGVEALELRPRGFILLHHALGIGHEDPPLRRQRHTPLTAVEQLAVQLILQLFQRRVDRLLSSENFCVAELIEPVSAT